MIKPKKLTPLEFHKWYKKTYRTIDRIKHPNHFKPIIKGGEVFLVEIDDNGKEVNNGLQRY